MQCEVQYMLALPTFCRVVKGNRDLERPFAAATCSAFSAKQSNYPHTCPHTCTHTSYYAFPAAITPSQQQLVMSAPEAQRRTPPLPSPPFPLSLPSLAPPPPPYLQLVGSHHVSHQRRQAMHHLRRCDAAQQLHQPCMVDTEQAIAYCLWYLGLGPHVSPWGREGVEEGGWR